jgi:hypothetical protein
VAELNVWRDSAFFYCDRIREGGGQANIIEYPSVPHLWFEMYPNMTISKIAE